MGILIIGKAVFILRYWYGIRLPVDKPGKLASEWLHINGVVVSRLLIAQYDYMGDARIEPLSILKRSIIYDDVIAVVWKYFVLCIYLCNHYYDLSHSSILIMANFYNFFDTILTTMQLIFTKDINYFRLHEHKLCICWALRCVVQ